MGFNWRDQDEQDLTLGADYSEQRLRAAQRERKNKSLSRRPEMARKPRIITRLSRTLRGHAKRLRIDADAFDVLAEQLEETDARETRLDPSKRKAKKAKARR